MKILIIDGQSGRIGSQLIESLRKTPPACEHTIIAVGANALATSAMLKAGAEAGATGENPVVVACRTADVIAGPVGIIAADAMMGEITPKMAKAVGQSSARKLLLPVNLCSIIVPGTQSLSLAALIDAAVETLRGLIG